MDFRMVSKGTHCIFEAVRNNVESNRNPGLSNQGDLDPDLSLGQMIKWLVCISSGMKYLSDKKMVHRDLRNSC